MILQIDSKSIPTLKSNVCLLIMSGTVLSNFGKLRTDTQKGKFGEVAGTC